MDPQLLQWVKDNGSAVKQEETFEVYELRTNSKFEDKKNRVRVKTIGPPNDLEVKTVLLLGETGVGKTTFLNTFLNVVYGVALKDPIRLHLKDQMDQQKAVTQSQTEYTTAYTIYHQNGMPFPYNYMIIDTPGLGDTDGQHKDKINENCLRFYLTNEEQIKHINSVGLVWKSSNQRLDMRNKEIVSKIKKLLGFDIKSMTDVLLTFSSFEDENAVSVIGVSGIEHKEVFHFDNIPLYQCPSKKERKAMHGMMWDTMVEHHHTFLQSLNQREPQDLKITARLLLTQAKLEDTERRLNALAQSSNVTSDQLESKQAKLMALEEEATRVEWDKIEELDTSSEVIHLDDGRHCHYCMECHKVCFPACTQIHRGIPSQAAASNTVSVSTEEVDSPVLNTMDQIGKQAEVFGSTTPGLPGAIAQVVTKVLTGVVLLGKLIVGAIQSVKSEVKTHALHAAEGTQQCHVCSHQVVRHEIRDKIMAKDANFVQKMELLKKKKYQEVMGKKDDLQSEIEATQKKIDEYEKRMEQEKRDLEESKMEVEQLQKGN